MKIGRAALVADDIDALVRGLKALLAGEIETGRDET
jgi:hypothetical protein